MRSLLLLLGLGACLGTRAQLLDSLGLFLEEPPKPVVKLDTRGSFISNRAVRMFGVKMGLEHGGRVQYGIGYSFLSSPVHRELYVEGEGVVGTRLRFGYVTPYFEYAFYQRGPWEVRIPVQLGIGAGSLIYHDQEGHMQRIRRTGVFLYEPSMTVQYRFLKYLGVGAGWGYRLAFTGADLGENLTAPIYLFGVKVFFGDLWRDLRAGRE